MLRVLEEILQQTLKKNKKVLYLGEEFWLSDRPFILRETLQLFLTKSFAFHRCWNFQG